VTAAKGDVSFVPTHLNPKVNDRIAKAKRKAPFLKDSDFASLARRLEYFDLRELQEVICSKQGWLIFEKVFATKEQLGQRFNQIAEVRNSIRHSRSLDSVSQKDGEAALLWFEHCAKELPAAGEAEVVGVPSSPDLSPVG
jgi:hypothetical protein